MPPSPTDIRGRVETDAADATIQALIDEAVEAITLRFGPYRGASPLTVSLPGRRRALMLDRPLDATQPIAIIDHESFDAFELGPGEDSESIWPAGVESDVTLDANDFRVSDGGRTLVRLQNGGHPAVFWGERVSVTYQPVDDTARRDEVAVKLVILGLGYDGVIQETTGDVSVTRGLRSAAGGESPLVYADERERLLKTLAPRPGLMLR